MQRHVPVDRSADKDRFGLMMKGWIDQFAHSLVTSDTKNYIQQLVIEPFLEYILQRSFPYLLIAIGVFSAMLIIIILIFVMLLFNSPTGARVTSICPFCEKTV